MYLDKTSHRAAEKVNIESILCHNVVPHSIICDMIIEEMKSARY